ncbi:MAG: CotH kinase family protein [Eubacteriales bacterium]|nr:CotH kinase family protein [Eubacteriales bacterium]
MSTSRHIDKICCVVTALSLLLSVLCLCFVNADTVQASRTMGYENRLFDQSKVHTIDIVMDDWDGFLETCTSEEYSACSVVIDGEAYKNVGIRGKGNTSLSSVAAYGNNRYSFKVEFDKYDSGCSYYGLDKLSLNNIIQDNTYLKDFLCYTLMNEMGVASPLCSFVYITVNGEDWGLYLAVEGVEDGFLQRNYGTSYGNLYKPDSLSFGGGRGNGMDFDMTAFQEEFGMQMPEAGGNAGEAGAGDDAAGNAASGGFCGSFGGPGAGGGSVMPGGDVNAAGGETTDSDAAASTSESETSGGVTADGDAAAGSSEGETSDGNAVPAMPDGESSGDSTMPAMPSGDSSDGSTMPTMPGDFGTGDSAGFGGGGGGFGESEGIGSEDVKLQYIDDAPDSYSNIFDNAKTDIDSSDQERLIASLKQLSEGESLEEVVDVDAVIRYLVVHNFVCNGDSYTGSMVHNYYLYEDDGGLSMIPWDYNLAFGGFSGGGAGGGFGSDSGATSEVNSPIDSPVDGDLESRPMVAWIFQDDTYLELYHQYYQEFITNCFDSGYFVELIDETVALISPYVEKDPTAFCTYEEFQTGVETLREFCLLRAESVSGQLDGTIPSTDEGQTADSSALIDASQISLTDMGSMNNTMGGGGDFGGGDGGNFGGGKPGGGGDFAKGGGFGGGDFAGNGESGGGDPGQTSDAFATLSSDSASSGASETEVSDSSTADASDSDSSAPGTADASASDSGNSDPGTADADASDSGSSDPGAADASASDPGAMAANAPGADSSGTDVPPSGTMDPNAFGAGSSDANAAPASPGDGSSGTSMEPPSDPSAASNEPSKDSIEPSEASSETPEDSSESSEDSTETSETSTESPEASTGSDPTRPDGQTMDFQNADFANMGDMGGMGNMGDMGASGNTSAFESLILLAVSALVLIIGIIIAKKYPH